MTDSYYLPGRKWRRRWSWIKRTFTGYSVAVANIKGTTIITHRPFHEPGIVTHKNTEHIRGIKVTSMIFDEFGTWPEDKHEKRS